MNPMCFGRLLAVMVMAPAMIAACAPRPPPPAPVTSRPKHPKYFIVDLLDRKAVFFRVEATFQGALDMCKNYKGEGNEQDSYVPIYSQNRNLPEYFDHLRKIAAKLIDDKDFDEKDMAFWTGAFVPGIDPDSLYFLNETENIYSPKNGKHFCPKTVNPLRGMANFGGHVYNPEIAIRMVLWPHGQWYDDTWYQSNYHSPTCMELVDYGWNVKRQQFYVACEQVKFPVQCKSWECGRVLTDVLYHPRMIRLNRTWKLAQQECLLSDKHYSLAGLEQATREFIHATSAEVTTSDRGVWIGGSVDLQNSTKDRILIRWVDGRSSTFEDLPKEIWCPSFKTDVLNLISSFRKKYRERQIAFIKRDKGKDCLSIKRVVDWNEIETYAPLCIVDHFDLQTDYDFDVTIYTRNTTFMELLHVCKKNFDPKSTHETLSFAHMSNDKVEHVFNAIVQQLKKNERKFLGPNAATALMWTGDYFERESGFGVLYSADKESRRAGISSFMHIAQHFCATKGIKSAHLFYMKMALEDLNSRYGEDLVRVHVVLKYVHGNEACFDLYPQLYNSIPIKALAVCQAHVS